MKFCSWKLLCLSIFAASPLLFSTASQAQDLTAEPDGVREYETIPEAFDDAFFSHDETFFNNRSIARQISWLFGIGFPENEMTADGREIHELYVELLEEQVSTTPRIRTPDLPNPYETSLTLTPIGELVQQDYEDLGFRQPIAPVPVAPQAQPQRPVPALW